MLRTTVAEVESSSTFVTLHTKNCIVKHPKNLVARNATRKVAPYVRFTVTKIKFQEEEKTYFFLKMCGNTRKTGFCCDHVAHVHVTITTIDNVLSAFR